MTPLVSIVIPTYNRRELLSLTLDSVFAQTYRPLDIVVVDDGSTDDTAAALRPLADAGRLRYFFKANSGTAASRNYGLERARGEFVTLLDHDDLWPQDKVAWQVEELLADPEAVLVYGYMESFGLERPYRWPPPDGPNGWVRDKLLRKNCIRSPGQTLMRTAAVRAIGGCDPNLRGADDWDLYLRLSANGRFIYRDRLALRYRAHHTNQSKQAWRLFRSAWEVHGRHAGRLPSRGNARTWLLCRMSMLHWFYTELRAKFRAELHGKLKGQRDP